MKRPRYLGNFNGCPVFRIDSDEAAARVWRSPRFESYGPAFRPGLMIDLPGFAMDVPPRLGADEATLYGNAPRLDAACSTTRLARSLRALYARSQSTRR